QQPYLGELVPKRTSRSRNNSACPLDDADQDNAIIRHTIAFLHSESKARSRCASSRRERRCFADGIEPGLTPRTPQRETGYPPSILPRAIFAPQRLKNGCCCKVGRRAAKTQFLIP